MARQQRQGQESPGVVGHVEGGSLGTARRVGVSLGVGRQGSLGGPGRLGQDGWGLESQGSRGSARLGRVRFGKTRQQRQAEDGRGMERTGMEGQPTHGGEWLAKASHGTNFY